jgi:DNA gyrase subunit A
VNELLVHVSGPDFPTGGIICGRSGFVDAYTKGRGRVILRAKHHVEDTNSGKQLIVFTEIPYQVNKTNIIEKIVDCVKDQRIKGISDVRDESDKDGLRLIVELKRGEDDAVIINQLFNYTPLQITFAIHNIALVNGKPIRLNLKQMMEHYRDHRIEVIRRKIQFLLNKAEARAHILEGLRIAIDNIDAIIALIRAASDTATAREQLMERFGLSERQASAILEMQLRRLTGLEREKIEEEYRELLVKIAEYKDILSDPGKVLDIIREDLNELKSKFGEPRRTEVGPATTGITDEDMIQDEEMAIMISHGGYIKRLPPSEFRTQGRGGKGVTGMATQENDFTEYLMIGSTKDYLMLFTNKGKVFWIKVYEIPLASRNSKGRSFNNFINLEDDEKVVNTINVKDFDERELIMATAQGMIKKTALTAYSNAKKRIGIIAIVLSEGDDLIDVRLSSGQDEIVLTSMNGQSIRFNEEEVRSVGRASKGVRGMNLAAEDKVVSMNIVEAEKLMMTICEKGYGKKSSFEEYSVRHRGGKGVKTVGNIDRNGTVVRSMTVAEDDELLMLTQEGMVVRISTSDFRVLGRATSGVRLMKFKKAEDRIISVVPLPIKDEVEDIPKEEAAKEEGSTEEES